MNRVSRALLIGGLAFAVLSAAAGFLAASAPGLRTLAAAATLLSGGRLAFEGVEGTLAGTFGIRSLRIERATQRIEITDLHVAWRPRALPDGVLDFDRIAARTLRIRVTRPDDAPATAPASLRPPLGVRVARIELAQFEYIGADETVSRFEALHARLDGRGDRWRLTETSVATAWGAAQARLELGKDAPFALSGQVDARIAGSLAMRGQARLAGTLIAPRFSFSAQAGAMRVLVHGEAAPFAPVKLVRMLVAGEGIDPGRFAADAPTARLAFSGVFEGRPGATLFGTFSLVNHLPGRLEAQRLPLVQLSGALLGDAAHATFSDLALDLGSAGRLAGRGTWQAGRFDLAFDGTRLDLAGLHGALAATRLDAHLTLAGDGARQTLSGTLREKRGQGRFSLLHADRVLALTGMDFSGEAGRLVAHGTMMLGVARTFALNFDATRIDPARFGRFPRGRLNARGEAKGVLAPGTMLEAHLILPPGELEGRPVRGEATLRYADAHLSHARVALDLAGNRVNLAGAWGRAGDRLDWEIDAPALARLHAGFAGRGTSRGRLSGAPAAPDVEAHAEAAGLTLPGGISVAALDARLKLVATARGAFEGHLDARGLRAAGLFSETLRVRLAGRRDAHTLSLDARLPAGQVRAGFAGGLDDAQVWRGQLRTAEATGAWPMQLVAPAALELSRTRQVVGALALTLAGGRVEVETLERAGREIVTRGSFVNLPAAPLLAHFGPPASVSTDLRLNGRWAGRQGAMPEGEVRIERASGDLRLTDPALTLGLARLDVRLLAAQDQARLHAEIVTHDAGQARFDARAPLVFAAGVPWFSRSTPVAWTAQVEVPDLRRAKSLLPVGVRLDARLRADLEGGGSLDAPDVTGALHVGALRFSLPEEGVSIEDGTLDLVLDGDRVRVRQGELKGGGGRIVVRGEAEFANPRAGLSLDFEKFALLRRSDRRVTVSGTAQLAFADRRLRLSGNLVADRARLEMPEASRPELSSDVRVIGAPAPGKSTAQRDPLALDLTLDLGEDFLFKGAGLDAKFGGRLRVVTVNGMARGEGSIRVTKGRYAAYAQTLEIERGVVRFAGPLDDPGLDILAVRRMPAVTAGVQVRGTAKRPWVTLYSVPAMPDTEKLAWLVLGHGLDTAGQQEFVLLQVAAGALLNQAESLNFQARLADTLGIDSLDVRAGEGETFDTAIVSVGKRLSSRATLFYERSVDGLSQTVKALYQLTPHVRLEAQTGEQGSFDAFYSLDYD